MRNTIKRKLTFLVTFIILFSISMLTPVRADTLDVPGVYPTIQAAINAASSGDTINLAAGSYNEAGISVNKSSLIIQGAGPGVTIIATDGFPIDLSTHSHRAIGVYANNITIKDLTITNSIQLVEGIHVGSPAVSGLSIDNVHFTNLDYTYPNNAYGIDIATNFSGLNITDCEFIGNTGVKSRPIGVIAAIPAGGLILSDFTVDNCIFSHLYVGVYIYRSGIDGLNVKNSIFESTELLDCEAAVSGIYIGDKGRAPDYDIKNINVHNNTFTDYGRGVYFLQYSDGRLIGQVDITNNTFTNSIYSSGIRLMASNYGLSQYAFSTLEGPVTIANNVFLQNQGITNGDGVAMIDIRAGLESMTSQILITNNEITFDGSFNRSTYGMIFRGPITGLDILSNNMNGMNVGGASANMPPTSSIIFASNSSGYGPLSSNAELNIFSNSIVRFVDGIAIYNYVNNTYGNLPSGVALNIHYNSIVCNTLAGVYSGPRMVTDAINNWWGCNNGPADGPDGFFGPGEGQPIGSTFVLYDPWLVLNLTANPSSIPADGTSTSDITAYMTMNSNGETSGGYAPNGTVVIFTATSGSIISPISTTSGMAPTIFTAGTAPTTSVILCDACECYECDTASIIVIQTAPEIPSVPVGGEVYAVNKISLIEPWIILVTTILGISIFLIRRKANS